MSTILTYANLESILLNPDIRKGQFIRLDSKTEARATKKSRVTSESFESLFGTSKIFKINSRTVQIGVSYESAVNGRREKEGMESNFVSAGTYGDVENNTIVRKSDGSWNMRVYHVKHNDDNVIWVREDGTELDDILVTRLKAEYLPIPKTSDKQGLDNQVMPLDFKPSSIIGFRMDGEDYLMAHI